MNASEARKLADSAKSEKEAALRIEKADFHDRNYDVLLNHFKQKIDDAAMEGKHIITPIEFPNDRFSLDVVREVINTLQKDGFNITHSLHNAYNKRKFEISW